MFPIRDNIKHPGQPYVVLALLALNAATYAWQSSGGQGHFEASVLDFGLRPALVSAYVDGEESVALPLLGEPRGLFARSREVDATPITALLPFVTSMFLHGSLFHLLFNLWFLWIFADNVEGRLRPVRFLLFYVACGLAAGVAQVVSAPSSPVPCVGASGAISGVLGAYFVFFPRAGVLTLIPLGFILQLLELPAFVFLLIWFGLQLLSGVGTSAATSGVAWWAHIGGFVAGVLLAIVARASLPPGPRPLRKSTR